MPIAVPYFPSNSSAAVNTEYSDADDDGEDYGSSDMASDRDNL